METTQSAFGLTDRNELLHELLHLEGVTRFGPNRRFATIYTEGNPADSLFFVETGLVKLFKGGGHTKEIITKLAAAGQIFGEQALVSGTSWNMSAEVLQEGVIHVLPRDLFIQFCEERPGLWREITELLVRNERRLEEKIELLSLRDVEYRILHYVADLAATIGVRGAAGEQVIPLTQAEVASLVGATRETTSTTLNGLARRGILRLGRRQLTVIAPEELRAARDRKSKAAGS